MKILIRNHREAIFSYTLCGLCLAYLAAAYFINATMMIGVDEFWFAHIVQYYKHNIPYLYFAPYKTVLGYYLLLIPFSITHSLIGTLIFAKNMIALCNAMVLFIAACWLTRFFSKTAID